MRSGSRRGRARPASRRRRSSTPPLASARSRGAERYASRRGQVGEPRVVAGVAAHPQAELGEPEQPRQAGLDHVDRLEPRERVALRATPQEPGLDLQVVLLDPPARDEPGDDAEESDHAEDRELDDATPMKSRPLTSAGRSTTTSAIAPRPARTNGESGCRRCQTRLEPACGCRVDAHSPAARASPSSARRSRSRAASAFASPGMRASLAAAAVWR